jgi:hypothetical protein
MQTGLIEHYMTEILQNWLSDLSKKFPMSPLNAILSNYLMFPEDGTNTARLHIVSHQLYKQIKMLEELPDEVAFEPEGDTLEQKAAAEQEGSIERLDVV